MAARSRREALTTLAGELASAAGDNLASSLIHGSALRAGYRGPDDLRLLVILADASPDALRPLEPIIARWVKRREAPPLIFSQTGWRASTDVFPMEIEDMREAHEVVAGRDPFDGLETDRTHLRHELEREVRGKLLQLRSEYAAVAPDGRRLTLLLCDSVATFFVLMRGLVRLVGQVPAADPSDLVDQAAEAAGLDRSAFQWVVGKFTSETVRALKPYDSIGVRYVEEIEKMARFVDEFAMEPEPSVSEHVKESTE